MVWTTATKRDCLGSRRLTRRKIKVTSRWSAQRGWTASTRSQKRLVSAWARSSGHGQPWTAPFLHDSGRRARLYQQRSRASSRATGTRTVASNAFGCAALTHTWTFSVVAYLPHDDEAVMSRSGHRARQPPPHLQSCLHINMNANPWELRHGLRHSMYATISKRRSRAYAEAGTRRRMSKLARMSHRRRPVSRPECSNGHHLRSIPILESH